MRGVVWSTSRRCVIGLGGVDEVVEQDEGCIGGSHDEGMGAMVQNRVVVHKLVIEDVVAGIGRVSEATDVLSIDGKGDVGKRVGRRGERVRDYVEDVHRGSGEMDGDCCRAMRRPICGVKPGLVVDLGEV